MSSSDRSTVLRFAALAALAAFACVGCSRTPAEPTPAASTRAAAPAVRLASAPVTPPAQPNVVGCPADPETPPVLRTETVSFASGPSVSAELVRTPAETERGLMYRTSMPEDQGMLFTLGAREEHTFWMHNTCIPLDMLFIDPDGTIVGILENVPILNDEPRTVGRPSTHVLEVNAGWSRRHGVKSGQRLLLPPGSK